MMMKWDILQVLTVLSWTSDKYFSQFYSWIPIQPQLFSSPTLLGSCMVCVEDDMVLISSDTLDRVWIFWGDCDLLASSNLSVWLSVQPLALLSHRYHLSLVFLSLSCFLNVLCHSASALLSFVLVYPNFVSNSFCHCFLCLFYIP